MSTDNKNDDVRTDSQKKVDSILGKTGATDSDRQFAKIEKAVCDLMGAGKATKRYLAAGEECYTYVHLAVGAGVERASAVSRITERLEECGYMPKDLRVNDWIAVYALARLTTETDNLAEIPNSWLNSVAYRSLAMLKVAVERDDTEYTFKPGWRDKVVDLITDGLKGDKLKAAITDHTAHLDELAKMARRRHLSPQRIEQEEKAAIVAEQDKKVKALEKTAEVLRTAAMDAGYAPEDIFGVLVNRGIVPENAPNNVPMDLLEYARLMDSDSAAKLAGAIVDRGNYAIVMAVASVLTGWLKANADAAKKSA